MKKNYSNPKFKLVILDSNDIVCTSETVTYSGGWDYNQGTPTAGAKQRGGIWGDDE